MSVENLTVFAMESKFDLGVQIFIPRLGLELSRGIRHKITCMLVGCLK